MDPDPNVALEKVVNDVHELINSVDRFSAWWSRVETMTQSLESQVVFAGRSRLSITRVNLVRGGCDMLRKDYEIYMRSVSDLQSLSNCV
jgi:hypothetical protein